MYVSGLPEHTVVRAGAFTLGVIHGHQLLPAGDVEAAAAFQRQLNCDVSLDMHTLSPSSASCFTLFYYRLIGGTLFLFSTFHLYSRCLLRGATLASAGIGMRTDS